MAVVGRAQVLITPNLTGFARKLKAELARVTVAAGEVKVRVPKSAIKLPSSQELERHSDALRRVGANAAAANEQVRRLLQELRNLLVITAGVSLLGRPFVNFAAAGFRAASSLEQARVSLESLLQSQSEADRLFARLQALAQRTPAAFQDLLPLAQQLIAVGQNADEVVRTLEAVLTAAAASGRVSKDVLDRAVLALTQIAASGKLLGQDLRQIFQALPAVGRTRVFEEIARQMGVTREQAQALAEEGLIPSEVALRGILSAMRSIPGAAEALDRQSRTLEGSFQRLREQIELALGEGFRRAAEVASQSLRGLSPAVFGVVTQLAEAFGKSLARVIPVLLTAGLSLARSLQPIIEVVVALSPALAGAAQAFAVLAQAIRPVAELISRIPVPVLSAIGAFITMRALLGVVAALVARALGPALTAVVAGLSSTGVAASTAAVGVSALSAALSALTAALSGVISALGIAASAFAVFSLFKSKDAQKSAEAKAQTEQITSALLSAAQASLQGADAVDQFNRAVTSVLQADKGLVERARKIGISLRDVRDALRDPGAVDSEVIERLGGRFEKLAKRLQQAARDTLEFLVAQGDLKKAVVDTAVGFNTAADGTVNWAKALIDALALSRDTTAATDGLSDALSANANVAAVAAARMRELTDAANEVKTVFDSAIGSVLAAARSEIDLEEANDRLADLERQLRDELHGTAEERAAVIQSERSLAQARKASAAAVRNAQQAVVELREAERNLALVQQTESQRAIQGIIQAKLDLLEVSQRAIDLELTELDLQRQLARAQDPRRIQELENLRRLRAAVGAAPPSFLDELDRRIEQLEREVGPLAVKRIQLELQKTALERQQVPIQIAQATQAVAEAEKALVSGTPELKRAREEVRRAQERVEEANERVRESTDRVRDAEQNLAAARRRLAPDAARVVELNRQIRDAQIRVVESAIAAAVAIGQAMSKTGSELKRNVADVLDQILKKFPRIAELFSGTVLELQTRFGISLKVEDLPNLLEEITKAVRNSVSEVLLKRPIKGAFQHGGRVPAGGPFLVGERGPELFFPDRPGVIVPNDQLRRLSTREAVTVNVTAPSTEAADIVDETIRALRRVRFLHGV